MLQNSVWARQPPFIECEIRIEFIFIYFFNNIKFVLVYYIVVALTVHDDYWIISSWNLLIIINTILNLNTICILSGFIHLCRFVENPDPLDLDAQFKTKLLQNIADKN